MAELVPTALEALLDALEHGTVAERIQAASEVLDRGGVPRSSQVETSLRADLQVWGRALLELAAKLPSGEPLVRRRPMSLPAGADPYAVAPAPFEGGYRPAGSPRGERIRCYTVTRGPLPLSFASSRSGAGRVPDRRHSSH